MRSGGGGRRGRTQPGQCQAAREAGSGTSDGRVTPQDRRRPLSSVTCEAVGAAGNRRSVCCR